VDESAPNRYNSSGISFWYIIPQNRLGLRKPESLFLKGCLSGHPVDPIGLPAAEPKPAGKTKEKKEEET